MPRHSPSSAAPGADREGGALVALSASVLAALVLVNLAPPERWWWPALLLGAVAAGACGVRRAPGGAGWWVLAGLCAGGVAGALAPRRPDAAVASPIPVRFVLTVRDGWQEGELGWWTRVAVERADGAAGPVSVPRELQLSVGGAATLSELPRPGDRCEGSGELAFQREWPLRRPQLRVKTARLLVPLAGGFSVDRARESGVQALLRSAGTEPALIRSAGLAAALVLGRRDRLPAGEVADLRRSGLAHLLAVSGLHVGLVGAFAWGVLMLAGVPPRGRRWVVASVLLAFAVLSGWGAPVRRAAFAGAAYLAARQLGRPLLSLPVVWAIVAGLAAFEPDAILQPGFQLSALVTLALVRWVEPLATRLGGLPRIMAGAAAVALVGQGASTPLVGQHFGTLSLLSVAANLAAAPIALALTVMSLTGLGAACLASGLGRIGLMALVPLHRTLDAVSSAAAPGAIEFPAMPLLAVVVLAAAGAWGLSRRRGAWAGAAAWIVTWAVWVAWPFSFRPACEIRMLPVRDGMALLLRNAGGAVLVDAGRSPDQACNALARERLHRLAAVVLTHADVDHTGGAARVLERLDVGALVFPARAGDHASLVALQRLATARGVTVRPVSAGERVVLGATPFDVLWPDREGPEDGNDASLVARVALPGADLLVTGDIEAPAETALLARYHDLPADVLQLAHHGSPTSSTGPFLAAVRPRVALAASGTAPRYRYPDVGVVRRVLAIPAVIEAQRNGAEAVALEDGAGTIRLDGEVTVPRRRRGRD